MNKKLILGAGVAVLVTAGLVIFFMGREAAPDVYSVVSDDGVFSLNIPTDAVPPGVDPKSIKATRIIQTDIAPVEGLKNLPVIAAYRMEPDGLVFTKPVSFAATLPLSDEALPLAYNVNETTHVIEHTPAVVTIDEDHVAHIEGELHHFSDTYFVGSPFFVYIDDLSAAYIGEKVTPNIHVSLINPTTWNNWSADWGTRTDVKTPWDISGTFAASNDVLSPAQYTDAPPKTAVYGKDYKANRTFTCVKKGFTSIIFQTDIGSNVITTQYGRTLVGVLGSIFSSGKESYQSTSYNVRTKLFECKESEGTAILNALNAMNKIRVIEYNGKYLPVDQLIVENEKGCGAPHYHAPGGVVATDGTKVADPGPQCGYGKVSEKPVKEIDKPR